MKIDVIFIISPYVILDYSTLGNYKLVFINAPYVILGYSTLGYSLLFSNVLSYSTLSNSKLLFTNSPFFKRLFHFKLF